MNNIFKVKAMRHTLPSTLIVLVITFITVFLISGCGATRNAHYKEESQDFVHGNKRLSGFLTLPKDGDKPFPVLVFVHGDGPTPYDAFGYYPYLWKHLAKKGIASYSWHKAGVKTSEGNWLHQSMDERADEVIAAINMLKKRDDIATYKIGLIGFSQGGWVLPLVAKKSNYPDFMVLVSGAINWLDQGDYLTINRLRRKGFSDASIMDALRCNKDGLQVLQPASSYSDYLQYNKNLSSKCKAFAEPVMDAGRFEFVKLNVTADAKEGLATIQHPTLAVFGDKDKNVDVAESMREYKRIFNESGNPNLTIKLYPNAQHSLFKSKYIKEGSSGGSIVLKMGLLGEDIFAEGYLDFVSTWVQQIAQQN